MSKTIRKCLDEQKPLQKSYDKALKLVAPKGSEGVYKKRDIGRAQNAIRDLAILADSFNQDDYAEVFVSEDFINLISSVLGASTIDAERKRLDDQLGEVTERRVRLIKLRDWTRSVLRNSYVDINPYEKTDVKSEKEALAEVEGSYLKKLAPVEKDEEAIREQFRSLKTPLDPIRSQLASTVIRLCIKQCQKQYEQVQNNPELLKLVNEPLEDAIRILNGVLIVGIKEKKG